MIIPNLGIIPNIRNGRGGAGTTGKTPFILNVSSSSFSPADGATVRWGNGANTNGTALGANDFRIYVPTRVRIRKIYGFSRVSTGGSSETSTLSILTNGTTATTITSALSTAGSTAFSKTDLDIVLNDGEYFCFRMDCPTWASNPVMSTINAVVLCEPIPSKTAGQYVLQFGQGSGSPTASTINYYGDLIVASTAGTTRTYIPKTGTIIAAYLFVRTSTSASAETFTYAFRLNNTTDTSITTTATLNATSNTFTNTSLNIAVTEGDYIELKASRPAWVTAPTGIVHRFIFVIQS